MKTLVFSATFASLLTQVLSVGEWAQCGGINYTGSTLCDSGLTCTYFNVSLPHTPGNCRLPDHPAGL
ncbi:hypothetical protein M408DRAFT_83605 [Serendipita vermifera MAFF 305830]|uniref:CBM1 domain-containing protein n=1 Tax=Serendipita vermifera MAFF 305830 TaxID=933852 RepID=A0A0C3AJ61_SERVB|nr:hypothetical protein M408DRAFT_83605 [Serendipita vermifera MAFF 305830]